MGVRTFALAADVKEAHRQVPIHPQDWHLLGCHAEKGADVYINTVGTFGVASASCCWSRVSSALGRLSRDLAADNAHMWHMVVADDYHQEAGGEHYRFALVAFFLICSTCGVPLSWDKTAGGKTIVWVGFELLHSTHHLGISQRRAECFTMWAREVAEKWPRFEEGLGRIMSWGHLKLKDPSSDPSIDSCHSIPGPQYAKFRRTSDSFSGVWQIGSRAPGITTAQSPRKAQRWRHACTRRPATRGRGSEDGSLSGTRWQVRCQRVAMVFTRTQGGRLALDLLHWPKTRSCHFILQCL